MNIAFFNFLYGAANKFTILNGLIIFCSVYLGWLVLASLIGYIRFAKNKHRAARNTVLALTAGLVSLLLASLIKIIALTNRPFVVLNIPPLFIPGDLGSFPSEHAAFFGAIAMVLWLRDRRAGIYYLVAAILIGLGRVMSGVHWPIDIFVGFVIAGLASLAIVQLNTSRSRLF